MNSRKDKIQFLNNVMRGKQTFINSRPIFVFLLHNEKKGTYTTEQNKVWSVEELVGGGGNRSNRNSNDGSEDNGRSLIGWQTTLLHPSFVYCGQWHPNPTAR